MAGQPGCGTSSVPSGCSRDSPGGAAGSELVPLHQMCCKGALGLTLKFRREIAALRGLLLWFLLAVSVPPLHVTELPVSPGLGIIQVKTITWGWLARMDWLHRDSDGLRAVLQGNFPF